MRSLLVETPKSPLPVISCAIDDVAYASLRSQHGTVDEPPRCNACNAPIDGPPGGSGLLLWTRGEEVRFDEPPLCAQCATAIGVTMLTQWELDD